MTTRSLVPMRKSAVVGFMLLLVTGCSTTPIASIPDQPAGPAHVAPLVSKGAVHQAAASDPDLLLFGTDPARQIVNNQAAQVPVIPIQSKADTSWTSPAAHVTPTGEHATSTAGFPAGSVAGDPVVRTVSEVDEPRNDNSLRACLPMQQQTFTELGRDFDPDIDATGKLVVYASTRHSRKPNLYMQAIKGRAVTQLTDDSASKIQPRFSPDGKKIAFASDREGQWDIYILDLDRRAVTQVTHSSDHELAPAWSPDGKWLAYSRLSSATGAWELWMASLEDGAERCIGTGLMPRFSPDGSRIAFQRPRQRDGRLFSIWTVQLNDGEPSWPTEVASEPGAALICPTWSPDGAKIAYCRVPVSSLSGSLGGATARPGLADIFIVSLEGADRERLTDGGASFSPCWSTEGRLYFSADRDGHERIWSLKTAGPAKPNLASTAMKND